MGEHETGRWVSNQYNKAGDKDGSMIVMRQHVEVINRNS
jgi:hypothetical protein